MTGNGQRVFDHVCRAGHEGIIAKLARAPYRGERTRTWLKVKCIKRQEFVIGGWRPSEKKRTFASLLLGAFEGDKLIYRGRVGTGFNVEDSRELQKKLDALARKTKAFEMVPRDISRRARWSGRSWWPRSPSPKRRRIATCATRRSLHCART